MVTCLSLFDAKCVVWRLVLVLFPLNIFSAESVTLTITRGDNNTVLTDAIIKIASLTGETRQKSIIGLTDATGKFTFTYSQPVIISISHLGYSTITDTLYSPEDKTYFIAPLSQSVPDVVVTGQYGINSVQNSVYEVKVLNSETLKSKGANNLREALQTELSVDLGQDPLFGSSMSINGISGEGVKIMVDGVPIVGRTDGKLDLSQITISNIDHIEIVEGPLSVIYGTDAIGGVVNIITKTFQKEKVNLNLRGYYESAGQYNAEFNSGFSFKKHQVYLSGGRNFFGGYTTLRTVPRFKEWKPREQYFADAKYIYNGNRFRISLTGSFFRELMLDRSSPKRTLSYDNNDTLWTYTGNDAHYLTYRPRAAASLMYRFKENNQLDVLLAYSGFFRFANSYVKNLVTGNGKLSQDKSAHDTARYHQLTGRATYALPAWNSKLNFLFGVDLNQEYITQTRIQGETKKRGDYAAFGSVRLTLVKNLDIQPAVRFAYNSLYRAPLIPSLNLRYGWNDRLVFRTSYGRGYRSPSIRELFLRFNIDAHVIEGNENLKPEDGHNAATSLSYFLKFGKHSFAFTASGFFNYIFNKIDLVLLGNNNSGTPVYQYSNFARYSTYGGEAGITYNWKQFRLAATTQLTGYRIIYNTNSDELLTMWSTDFTASAGYLIPKAEIGVNVNYKFNGAKPLFSVDRQFREGKRLAYHLLDISLSRNFWKDRIQLVVGAKNLAGVKNVAVEGAVVVGHSTNPGRVNIGWGQTFFTTLVLHFGK